MEGIDFTPLITELKKTPVPDGVDYLPSVKELESTEVMSHLSVKSYGEMPIQIGYCNGHNKMLNALEYHRDSEVNVAATDAILILGLVGDIRNLTYDTAKAEAFLVPAGTAVEVYATTLHYAPCGVDGKGFQVAIVLPKGTNYPLKEKHDGGEDNHITAVNKWLLGHPEGGLPAGSPMGLIGKNLNIEE